MIRCKGFYDCNDTEKLCERIDKWLVENKIDTIKMDTVASGRLDHHVSIVVWYNEEERGE